MVLCRYGAPRRCEGAHLILKYAVQLAEERAGEGTVFSCGEIATILKKLAISDEVERAWTLPRIPGGLIIMIDIRVMFSV